MGRAARELNTVQSNVTQRVRRLEEALGVSLFERSRAGARLTPAGERLMPYATRVDALLDEAGRAARDDGAPRGTLTVGSLETTAALRLSPLLASCVQAHPGVDFVLRTGTTAEMVERVLGRELEGAFGGGPTCASSSCGPAAPIASGWRNCWRGAVWSVCGGLSSARSRRSWVPSPPALASR